MLTIKNVDRSAGAMLSGEVAKRYGQKGLKDDTITVKPHGHCRPVLRRLPGARRDLRS
jgi:glutamate synthase domain-containing protein 3